MKDISVQYVNIPATTLCISLTKYDIHQVDEGDSISNVE